MGDFYVTMSRLVWAVWDVARGCDGNFFLRFFFEAVVAALAFVCVFAVFLLEFAKKRRVGHDLNERHVLVYALLFEFVDSCFELGLFVIGQMFVADYAFTVSLRWLAYIVRLGCVLFVVFVFCLVFVVV